MAHGDGLCRAYEIVFHIQAILITLCSGSVWVFCGMLGLANIFSISLNTEFKDQLEFT